MRFFLILYTISVVFSGERFPPPSVEQQECDQAIVTDLGKKEIKSLPFRVLSQFLWDWFVRATAPVFDYYGANPTSLSLEEQNLPAMVLIHGSNSDQALWLALLHDIEEAKKHGVPLGPVFTFNYEERDGADLEALIEKIEAVKTLYQSYGINQVELYLVGHSLGGMTAAEYAFSPGIHVSGTKVSKVITLACRLKNIEPPEKTPYYGYCYPVLQRVDKIYHLIKNSDRNIRFYTITAGKDWLVPRESSSPFPEFASCTVPDKGHTLVIYSHQARNQIIHWFLE